MAAHIGIVGCSAEGAALCLRTLCAEGPALLGAHAHPEITMHVAPLADVRLLEAGDLAGVGELMLASARKLVAAGADVLICPDNTLHAAFDHIAGRVTRPWLHIAEVVAEAAAARAFRRVGLLGTRWLVTSDVYPARLAARGIEVVRPEERDVDAVHRIIMEELVPARPSDTAGPALREVIGRLAEAGCDAVILGCTELPLVLDDTTSPLPTLDSTRLLARAALRWTQSAPARDPAVGALDRLYAKVFTTRLRHHRRANPRHTTALMSLQFGYGYARLARPDRARELIAEAHVQIPQPDAAHAWLFAAYEARIEQVLAGAPREAPLPEAVAAQLAALDSADRYKVDRLREVSTILEPIVTVDAIGGFSRKLGDGRGADIARLALLATPARAAEIARLIEFAATDTAEDERILGGAFDHLIGLPADLALPIWTRATALVAEAPAADRTALYARALAVGAWFGQLERAAGDLVPMLRDALAHAPVGPLGWALSRALCTLQTRDRRDEVETLVGAFEARATETDEDRVARAAHAGALARLGDLRRAEAILDSIRAEHRRAITSAVGRAYAWFPSNFSVPLVAELADALCDVSDALSTNTHYALGILDFVEGLVLGATGAPA